MKVQGSDVILSIDELQVAAAQACELDVQQEFISICAPHGGGRWKRYKPSTIGWTASINMLIVAMDNPQAWLNEMKASAQPLTMRYYDKNLKMYQKGEVWIANWHNGAQVGSLATFSVQLQGNGELKNVEWTEVTLNGELENTEIYCTGNQVYIQQNTNESIMHKVMTFTTPTKVRLDAPFGTCIVVKRGADIPEPGVNPVNITSTVAMHAHQPSTPRVVDAILPAGIYTFMADKTDIQKTTPPTANVFA